MDRDTLREMREGIACEKGLALYREYDEEQAAAFLDMHRRTLAQVRREGRIYFVRKGPRNIRYLGMHIADFIIGSIEQIEAPSEDPAPQAPHQRPRKEQHAKVSGLEAAQRAFGVPNDKPK